MMPRFAPFLIGVARAEGIIDFNDGAVVIEIFDSAFQRDLDDAGLVATHRQLRRCRQFEDIGPGPQCHRLDEFALSEKAVGVHFTMCLCRAIVTPGSRRN